MLFSASARQGPLNDVPCVVFRFMGVFREFYGFESFTQLKKCYFRNQLVKVLRMVCLELFFVWWVFSGEFYGRIPGFPWFMWEFFQVLIILRNWVWFLKNQVSRVSFSKISIIWGFYGIFWGNECPNWPNFFFAQSLDMHCCNKKKLNRKDYSCSEKNVWQNVRQSDRQTVRQTDRQTDEISNVT